ncbi:MAG TPA: cytochrome c peroxidase [Bryobacterales bacterium]|jgi:cytochrome c peroxidase|nr:cytochrome c peroxidase [Bryobacterales bacterium]
MLAAMMRLVCWWLLGCVLFAADPPFSILTGKPPAPPDNPPTPAKVELGKKLFFDNRLSGPGNRSCGTCHRPELMYSDGLSRAWGLAESELRRKTPQLYNVGWHKRLFHDARAGSLEEQAAFPLRAEFEMDLDPNTAAERIRKDPQYQRLFAAAFPGREITWKLMAEAIASFERTLVSYDSDLDRYLAGDQAALGEAAKRGMALFTGKAGCSNCHNGPLLSDQKMHYIGVQEMAGDSPQGTPYKTPSLRDIVLRGSYMHNGRYRTLDEVLAFYQGVDMVRSPKGEAPPLELTSSEKSDLMAFLRSLTGRVYSVDLEEPEPVGTPPFGPHR